MSVLITVHDPLIARSVSELQAFARTCNGGEELADDELEQVRDFFEHDRGRLTRTGFMQMLHMQTCARPADTWRDLRALGFDTALSVPPPGGEGAAPTAATATCAAPGTDNAEPPTAAGQCARSADLHRRGEHELALRAALAALQLDSDLAEAHRCCARALSALGRDDAARRSMERADAIDRAAG